MPDLTLRMTIFATCLRVSARAVRHSARIATRGLRTAIAFEVISADGHPALSACGQPSDRGGLEIELYVEGVACRRARFRIAQEWHGAVRRVIRDQSVDVFGDNAGRTRHLLAVPVLRLVFITAIPFLGGLRSCWMVVCDQPRGDPVGDGVGG